MAERYPNCVMCRRGLYRRRYQQHVLTDNLSRTRPEFAAYIQEHAVLEVAFDDTRRVCHRCWQSVENVVRTLAEPAVPEVVAAVPLIEPALPVIEPAIPEVVYYIQVPEYTRAPNTPRHCIFNNCQNTTRHRIPEATKTYMFREHKLYIPHGARVCVQHLNANIWNELPQSCNTSHNFNAEQISDICDMLREALRRGSRLHFHTRDAMSDDDMHFWTGRKNEEFDIMLEQTPSLSIRCKDPRTALGTYLVKLRSGEPNQRLATLFNISRIKVGRHLAIVRECLRDDYVRLHLGVDHKTRNDLLQKNLTIPKALFGNEDNEKLILLADGTYIYINKSINFLFQRLSYSLHKFQNLLKPFLLVCSDGYILDVMGPYAATKTDASIMADIMNDEEHPLHCLLEENDVFLLDRGFRDSLDLIEACGYESYVPPSKDRNETQLTTDQANEARSVTLCRWVVEIVNGRFKRDFKLLRQKYFNKTLPNMFTDFKIAAAMTNHFHVPIVDSVRAEAFLNSIREKIDVPNLLHIYVERKRLNSRRVNFERIEASQIQHFPQMTEEQVILLSLGTYQLKLAKSYCSEHITNGLYIIEVYREHELEDLSDYGINEDAWLLRGRIQSRHIRSRKYYCYILVKNNQTNDNNIIQHYCTCLTGRRTVGTCTHIVSIVWYLGYARHEGFTAPALFLNDVIIDTNH